ncbi:DinB family protein [uncultured Marivirga sp.]|uniref:DinB family protein n=1 Tax=uncultured Marivirga sp. TaxID=1123707 RepID=UPI0030ECC75F|tara:strand:- start:328488 stop:328985 length:498 start_codon:yes stop_codon:yes gene_type:complete
MKNQSYIDFAYYNIWANNRFIESLSKHEEDLLSQQIESSFPSILKTISHIWMAEMGWLSRLEGYGWETSKIINFSGNANEMFKAWQSTSLSFKEFVENTDLEQKLDFEHKGESFSIPFREIAQTVFNHGSYHRGQLVMMMRQLGITDIPKTDYIEWVREKARANR